MKRYAAGDFTDYRRPTIGADFMTKEVVEGDQPMLLQVQYSRRQSGQVFRSPHTYAFTYVPKAPALEELDVIKLVAVGSRFPQG